MTGSGSGSCSKHKQCVSGKFHKNEYIEKINMYHEIIKNTIISCHKYKLTGIISLNDVNQCIYSLEKINILLLSIREFIDNPSDNIEVNDMFNSNSNTHKTMEEYIEEKIINDLQFVNNSISNLIKHFGTYYIDDLMNICFGKNYVSKILDSDKDLQDKYSILSKYCHPINYKVLNWSKKNKKYLGTSSSNTMNEKSKSSGKKPVSSSSSSVSFVNKPIQKNKLIDDNMLIDSAENLECFDLARSNTDFKIRVYGIKFTIHNPENNQTIIVFCLVDDMFPECMNYPFIKNKLFDLRMIEFDDNVFNPDIWERYIHTLMLKDLLVYNIKELYDKYVGYITQSNIMKNKPVYQIVQDFIGSELYIQRTTIIQLLLNIDKQEFQYIAYLLYDLLSNDTNGVVDTSEQTQILDSLPYKYKHYFKDAMAQTINYTNSLYNFDANKIPLEQQICLMKVNDYVKEKAMQKMKEVKSKSDDSGSKARQYLDGLLKIPFSIYREEHILTVRREMNEHFERLRETFIYGERFRCPTRLRDSLNKILTENSIISLKNTNYNNLEIHNFIYSLRNTYGLNREILESVMTDIPTIKKTTLVKISAYINSLFAGGEYPDFTQYLPNDNTRLDVKLDVAGLRGQLLDFMKALSLSLSHTHTLNISDNERHVSFIDRMIKTIYTVQDTKYDIYPLYNTINRSIQYIGDKNQEIKDYMVDVNKTLDNAVYGHKNAKKLIERIIGQWINGESTGYSFGFEGAAGIGKTTLAKKGIAKCLKDQNGESRPFAFIAIGGSSNASVLDGHSYTYVGSTWGKIVEVLIEKKCMNPIFFIDELDKVSRTEHGREIISILTHIIDGTQNTGFQDKYFSGIDIDLSKALFIFSYNDVELIDRILLDRIHRIRFDNISIDDKLIIARNYILPEIYQKVGLTGGVLSMDDEVLKFIITHYTHESGVRKFKEILFEIIGEINLSLLKNTYNPLVSGAKDTYTDTDTYIELPIVITREEVERILHERHPLKKVRINDVSKVGVINGLWANSLGNGGILHIEVAMFATTTFFDLKLTGMQGDVMKESMQVAKTLSWSLLDEATQTAWIERFERTKIQGVHIHVPEGATPKDGPSAGTAITTAIYSLLTGRRIKNDIAITGEMCLQGRVTAIGGLDLKIIGGIMAGVKTFLFPTENQKDFDLFLEKYRDKEIIKGIEFRPIATIQEAFDLVLEPL